MESRTLLERALLRFLASSYHAYYCKSDKPVLEVLLDKRRMILCNQTRGAATNGSLPVAATQSLRWRKMLLKSPLAAARMRACSAGVMPDTSERRRPALFMRHNPATSSCKDPSVTGESCRKSSCAAVRA
jgi:hypothetical protein